MLRYLKASGLVALLLVPVIASAQSSQDALRNAIQASILADQRAQTIPPEELKSLVDALAAQAQAQHMSAEDILWKPSNASEAAAGAAPLNLPDQTDQCVMGWEGYLCQFNQVFGFAGNNYEIPLFLLVVTGLLIAVIWEVIAHHRKKLAKQAATSVPVWEKTPPVQPPAH